MCSMFPLLGGIHSSNRSVPVLFTGRGCCERQSIVSISSAQPIFLKVSTGFQVLKARVSKIFLSMASFSILKLLLFYCAIFCLNNSALSGLWVVIFEGYLHCKVEQVLSFMSRNPHNPYYLELLDEEERRSTGADIRDRRLLRGTTIGQIVNWSNNAFININRFRTEDIVWLVGLI